MRRAGHRLRAVLRARSTGQGAGSFDLAAPDQAGLAARLLTLEPWQLRRLSNAIEAAISFARKVIRPRGSPLAEATHASAVMSSATTVTRSPLLTDATVRVARSPNATTFTQRVMLSPAPRAGISMASRNSTPSVPLRVVNGWGSSPHQERP